MVTGNIAAVDVDGLNTPASEIANYKRQGKQVICYISAGTLETYRSDAYDS